MKNFPLRSPFDDDEYTEDHEFYDPFEGRRPKKSGSAFYEDPFANNIPHNGWCRVPSCYSEEPRRIRRRPFRQRDNEIPRSQDKLKLIFCQSQPKKSAYVSLGTSIYTIEEESPDEYQMKSNHSSSSSKVQENHDQNHIDDIVKQRASKRIASWLHQTGLVDEFFVDMKSLPQNRYSMDGSVNSKRSQEGIEIGMHGYALEGTGEAAERKIKELKATIVREMDKLDDKIQQEEENQCSALQPLNPKECPPTVQSAIHALVNIDTTLSEVDYFQSVEENCERLTLELAMIGDKLGGVSDIVDDHITMQSFLVQLTLEWMKRPNFIDAEHFLQDKIVSIRELGHKLRSKLLQSIGTTFGDQDVEALKVLVDAIELYENQYDKLDHNDIVRVTKIKSIIITGVKKIATERILVRFTMVGLSMLLPFFCS